MTREQAFSLYATLEDQGWNVKFDPPSIPGDRGEYKVWVYVGEGEGGSRFRYTSTETIEKLIAISRQWDLMLKWTCWGDSGGIRAGFISAHEDE